MRNDTYGPQGRGKPDDYWLNPPTHKSNEPKQTGQHILESREGGRAICPGCGSGDIVFDYNKAEAWCANCGLVINENLCSSPSFDHLTDVDSQRYSGIPPTTITPSLPNPVSHKTSQRLTRDLPSELDKSIDDVVDNVLREVIPNTEVRKKVRDEIRKGVRFRYEHFQKKKQSWGRIAYRDEMLEIFTYDEINNNEEIKRHLPYETITDSDKRNRKDHHAVLSTEEETVFLSVVPIGRENAIGAREIRDNLLKVVKNTEPLFCLKRLVEEGKVNRESESNEQETKDVYWREKEDKELKKEIKRHDPAPFPTPIPEKLIKYIAPSLYECRHDHDKKKRKKMWAVSTEEETYLDSIGRKRKRLKGWTYPDSLEQCLIEPSKWVNLRSRIDEIMKGINERIAKLSLKEMKMGFVVCKYIFCIKELERLDGCKYLKTDGEIIDILGIAPTTFKKRMNELYVLN